MSRKLAKPRHGLFVTGTDTAVGKTFVASMLVRSLRRAGRTVGVYKPAASGCQRLADELLAEDAVALWEAAGRPGNLADVCPQRFEAPLAPHLAARAEGKELNADLLRTGLQHWRGRCDLVIVEGAGGLMSPLGDDEYVADLACDFGYPLIVVARNALGVINQTLQTLITAATYREGLPVAAVVLNEPLAKPDDPSRRSNFEQLACRCTVPVLIQVAQGSDEQISRVDWWALATADPGGRRCAVRLPISAPSQVGTAT